MKRFRGYPECRDSGVEWLGEIPAHWEVRRLKDHVEVNALVLPDDTDSDYKFDYVDIGSVEVGQLSSAVKAIRFGSSPSRARRVVRPGDTLVSTVRTYLKAVWTPTLFERDLIASTGFAVLTPNSDSVADYLGYFCQSDPFTDAVSAESVGIAYPAITEAMLGFVPICVPPLPEQRAIADFLDRQTSRIGRLVRKKERLIELLNEKRASLISHAVTRGLNTDVPMRNSGVEWLGEIPAHWDVIALRHLAVKFGSGITPRGGATAYETNGIPFLRSQNVHFDGLRLAGVARIPRRLHATMRGTHVKPGDVLLNITGASIGRVCAVPNDLTEANVNQHVCIIRPRREHVRPHFLAAFLSTSGMQETIALEQVGASRQGLTLDAIRSFKLFVPPLAEQRAIADFLDHETRQIDALVTKTLDVIKQLREYRTSVISAAVTGRIDVRDPFTTALTRPRQAGWSEATSAPIIPDM